MNTPTHFPIWAAPAAWRRLVQLLLIAVALGLAGCATGPGKEQAMQWPDLPVQEAVPRVTSNANTPKQYRGDAARHLYERNGQRIFKGKMPPLLYAVGVLNVDIDKQGQVSHLHWTRAPRHAPEVIAEIERTVLAAAPYPAPQKMGHVTYTDVWLWDKSGRFQLDTLTEGQR